jgi:predicted O-methyltransferase YrrM
MKDFTSDWVTIHEDHWQQYVFPNLPASGPLKWLEIGSYEGRSACRAAEFLQTRPGSQLHCVDLWYSRPQEGRFDKNTRDLKLLKKHKTDSVSWLAKALGEKQTFDLIYIDGDHEAKGVLSDAVLAWRLLKKGGILVFDDYPFVAPINQPDWALTKKPPKPAIDAFLDIWGSEMTVLGIHWQVYIQKTA